MSYSVEGTLPVIGCDAVHGSKFDWTANRNGRNSSPRDVTENLIPHHSAASRDDESVDTVIRKCLQAGPLTLDAAAGRGNKCGVSGFIKDLPHSIDEFCGEGIGDVRKKDTDRVQVTHPQLTSHHIRSVVQLFNRL